MGRFKNFHSKGRFANIVFSSFTSVVFKLFSFFCTFILTRLIIGNYGSELNGMIASITQYLGLIVLLEGGVGGVARAVLFEPLLKKDNEQIRKIITYLERFFRILALGFLCFAFLIAFIFPFFESEFDFIFTFTLVLIISISIFCEYFFGMSYSVLLAADQKVYLVNIVTFVSTLFNFFICVLLVLNKCPIHIVKLVSAAMLTIRPVVLSVYCKKKYHIKSVKLARTENLLPQKWSGLGVHIAFYLHRNIDTFLITIFLSFSMVSVYSVYNMIVGGLLTVIGALSIGIEAAFGNMFANKEFSNLKKRFKVYVFYYQFLCTFLLSCALILIIPFVKIYTNGVNDINYIHPLFALLFIVSEFFYCLRVPYNDLMIATNSFKKIQFGAYLEAIINIALSLLLINLLGIVGVAIGTLTAMVFRIIHFLYFFYKHKLNLKPSWFLRLTSASSLIMFLSFALSNYLNFNVEVSYISWIFYAIKICFYVMLISLVVYPLICKKQFCDFVVFLKGKILKENNKGVLK